MVQLCKIYPNFYRVPPEIFFRVASTQIFSGCSQIKDPLSKVGFRENLALLETFQSSCMYLFFRKVAQEICWQIKIGQFSEETFFCHISSNAIEISCKPPLHTVNVNVVKPLIQSYSSKYSKHLGIGTRLSMAGISLMVGPKMQTQFRWKRPKSWFETALD